VVVGARTGTVRGTTDANGHLQLGARQGTAIVAIRAEGLSVHFCEAPEVDDAWQFTLPPVGRPPVQGDLKSIWDVPQTEFTAAAEKVFSAIEKPDLKSSTLYRIRLYVDALASLNPEECLRYILGNLPQNPQLVQFALAGAEKAIARQPQLVEMFERIPFVPQDQRCYAFLLAATATSDTDLRDEWLGEALLAARNSSGRERIYSMSRLAQTLLAFGRVDLAKQLVNEAWSSTSELQEIVQTGKRRQLVGESRTLCTMSAIVDLERAMKAIEQAILAPARIDPDWSVEVVNRLCSGTLQQQSADQLELRSAMTRALTASQDDRP